MVLSLTGSVLKCASTPTPSVLLGTKKSVVDHATVLDLLDLNPWWLPRSIESLFSLLGVEYTFPDPAQIRAPYVVDDGMITIKEERSLTGTSVEMDADTFVHGVRTGRVVALTDGYAMQYDSGKWGSVRCEVDLVEFSWRLEAFSDSLLPIGCHPIKFPGPDALLLEHFGSAYDPVARTVTLS
jgi:hypothetical protein